MEELRLLLPRPLLPPSKPNLKPRNPLQSLNNQMQRLCLPNKLKRLFLKRKPQSLLKSKNLRSKSRTLKPSPLWPKLNLLKLVKNQSKKALNPNLRNKSQTRILRVKTRIPPQLQPKRDPPRNKKRAETLILNLRRKPPRRLKLRSHLPRLLPRLSQLLLPREKLPNRALTSMMRNQNKRLPKPKEEKPQKTLLSKRPIRERKPRKRKENSRFMSEVLLGLSESKNLKVFSPPTERSPLLDS